MEIAILGFGHQGRSAFDYWHTAANHLTVCDKDEKTVVPADATARLGADYLKNLDEFDVIVRSPSVHPREIVAANSQEILRKVTTNTNIFMRDCPTDNIIGVTGTKGKGTTSTLIAKMLEATGARVHVGGNIGTPPLDMLKLGIDQQDWVVLELANFQIIDLVISPHIAVCLMVVPEHLDWHADMNEYIQTKQQLFAHQQPVDIAIYYAENENSQKVASASPGNKIPYFAEPGAVVADGKIQIDGHVICETRELKLLGEHNWQNVCAAVTAAWQISQDINAMRSVLISFAGLPHRLEFVREIDKVKFYNDSFAATPEAAMAAMKAIPGKKVMIIGGFDRQLPLDNLARAMAALPDGLEKVLLIGASANRVAAAFQDADFANFQVSTARTMAEIVQTARGLAKPGEAVVLSPGFASFDMFKNFEDRGNQFKETVNLL